MIYTCSGRTDKIVPVHAYEVLAPLDGQPRGVEILQLPEHRRQVLLLQGLRDGVAQAVGVEGGEVEGGLAAPAGCGAARAVLVVHHLPRRVED